MDSFSIMYNSLDNYYCQAHLQNKHKQTKCKNSIKLHCHYYELLLTTKDPLYFQGEMFIAIY